MVLPSAENKLSWLTSWLPTTSSALLVIAIAYLLATPFWQVIAPRPPRDSLSPRNPSPLTWTKSPRPIYDKQIAQLHLFGEASKVQTDQVPVAPETRLNLNLRGVFSSDDQKNALAIIASGGTDERYYRVGDSIPGGATLKAVYPDRVLLERNLQMETLALPKGKDPGIRISVQPVTATSTALIHANSGAKLNQLRQRILKNPTQLNKMLSARPFSKDGQFVGYRLSLRENAGLARELGLESGDIVTSVNGITLDRPEKGLNALQNLVSAPEVTLTLLRNGSEVTVHHSLTR
jgi:general secretion pathway protein C